MSHEQFGLPAYAIDQLREVFSLWSQIDRVLLYGSRAKGNYRPVSDIDLTIEGRARIWLPVGCCDPRLCNIYCIRHPAANHSTVRLITDTLVETVYHSSPWPGCMDES